MRKLFSIFIIFTLVFGLVFSFSLFVSADDSIEVSSEPFVQVDGIPEGYRLLTADDADKTFGVDFAGSVYVDTSVVPFVTSEQSLFGLFLVSSSELSLISNFSSIAFGSYLLYTDNSWDTAVVSEFSSLDFSTPALEIGFIDNSIDWNNWFYVKPLNEEPTEPTVTITKGYYQWPDEVPNSALAYLFDTYGTNGISLSKPFYTLTASYRFTDIVYRVSEWSTFGVDVYKRGSDEFSWYSMNYSPYGGNAPTLEVYGGVSGIYWDSDKMLDVSVPDDTAYVTPPNVGKVIYIPDDIEVSQSDFDNFFVFLQPTDSFEGSNPPAFDNLLLYIFEKLTEALDGVEFYKGVTAWNIITSVVGLLFFVWVLKVIAGG